MSAWMQRDGVKVKQKQASLLDSEATHSSRWSTTDGGANDANNEEMMAAPRQRGGHWPFIVVSLASVCVS